MTSSLVDCLAVVTGTSTGIGSALARALLEQGWQVVGIARRPADPGHPDYSHLIADLGDALALDDIVDNHLNPLLGQQKWRRVALINNAARIGAMATVPDLNTRELNAVMAVNVTAPVRLMGAVLQGAPASAALRIVNISSGAAHMAIAGLADYSASKAALRAAGRIAAVELEGSGRDAAIFSYEPGVVDTPMQDAARGSDPQRFPAHATFVGFQAQGVLARPGDVVGPVLDFVSGQPAEVFTEARYDPVT